VKSKLSRSLLKLLIFWAKINVKHYSKIQELSWQMVINFKLKGRVQERPLDFSAIFESAQN